MAIAPE